MCGRYRLSRAQRFAEINDIRLGIDFPPHYNIAPTQRVPVVLDESPKEMTAAQWGLIPSWAKDRKIGSSLINARCETVVSKPAFRSAFKRRHCLVPVDGFYEWRKTGGPKVPYHIAMKDGEPFAFAGIWEVWRDPAAPDAEPLRTFTVITCDANELLAPVHNRMPVILSRDDYSTWLSPETSEGKRTALLKPFSADQMEIYPISTRINKPENDDPTLIERLSDPGPASNSA